MAVVLQQVKGKGKESGKDFTAYQFQIGSWKRRYMFLSPFELEYIVSSYEVEYHESN